MAEAFAPALDFALAEFVACGAPADTLLPVLTGLAARGVDDNRQLVEQAFAKTIGAGKCVPATIGRLATAIGGLKAGYLNAYHSTVGDAAAAAETRPMIDELLDRGRPLLGTVGNPRPRLCAANCPLDRRKRRRPGRRGHRWCIRLVGGNGIAHRALNAVTFEAVPP